MSQVSIGHTSHVFIVHTYLYICIFLYIYWFICRRYVDDERVWGVETQQMYAYEYRYDAMYDADTPHNQVCCVFVCWREREGGGEGEGEGEGD